MGLLHSHSDLYEPALPNILFAQDGDIDQIGKLVTLVLNDGLREDSFRDRIFEYLESVDWGVTLVLSRYAPMKVRRRRAPVQDV